jgi:hypothetical protein
MSPGLALLAALALAACSGSTPQLIGSYPKGGGAAPTRIPPPADHLVVYDDYLALEVSDTDAAARRAAQLAYDHGGYVVSSQAWFQDGRKHFTLTLAVPAARFDSVRAALLRLGALVTENVSGERASTAHGANEWNTFSHMTVQLRPRPSAAALPSLPSTGWDPARTFERAFGVFASIFTFLVDVVIWATVVVGPFALMGMGARALARRLKRP